LNVNTNPPSTQENDDVALIIDFGNFLAKVNVSMCILVLTKFSPQIDQVHKFSNIGKEPNDPPIILQNMHYDQKSRGVHLSSSY